MGQAGQQRSELTVGQWVIGQMGQQIWILPNFVQTLMTESRDKQTNKQINATDNNTPSEVK